MESRAPKVKNKNPATLQITAEQLLREAKSRTDQKVAPPKQKIIDQEELDAYRYDKRKVFEDAIRRNRTAIGAWLKYAAWEESQYEYERARSVFERALDIDHSAQVLWMKYAEMEMRHKNVNRARNIFDRVVAVLPRIDAFWYKYTFMEELLENVAGTRQIFERWMEWEPSEEAWMAYVKFETRYNELERSRQVFKRFVSVYPQPKNWLKWAKFEEQNGKPDFAREIYSQCISTLGDEFIDQNFYISFAKFETRLKEIERARVIYKYAIDKLPEGQKQNLYNVYSQFEKQYGGKDGIEEVIVAKRRLKYEEELSQNSRNYDVWFDYLRLEENNGRAEKIREVYERAIGETPLVEEKRFWRRYLYIWLFYATWEESVAKDMDRTKAIYTQLLKIIPHKKFTFAKAWLMYAKFLVRQKDLNGARKTLGAAIGTGAKDKLFKGYIELELSLREFDRVRVLYQKYLEWNPINCFAWIKYTELESMLGETERARSIYEIAVNQGELDMPEVLWKAYIDFEVNECEWSNARALYKRLLERTDHVKVHISFANFEYSALDADQDKRIERARQYFESINNAYKTNKVKDERTVLLEAWLEFEKQNGDEEWISKVQEKLPKAVKKRRRIQDDNGVSGWEEYYDYIFPGDEAEKPNLKFVALAHQWKMGALDEDSDEDEEDDEEE